MEIDCNLSKCWIKEELRNFSYLAMFLKLWILINSQLNSRCTLFYIINRVGVGLCKIKESESEPQSDDLSSDFTALI